MERKPVSRRDRPAKSALSREAVIETALALLKDEGLDKITMRRIAAVLDTGPASLYVYVKDTRDLHAQILEALLAELPAPRPGRHWRRDLGRVAEAFLVLLMRYPELARLAMATISTGPNALRLLDTIAGLLLEGGASVRGAAWGVDLVNAFVTATAIEHSWRPDGDAAVAEVRHAVEKLDAKTHPHLAQLGDELFSGEGLERFRWGLDAIVNGVLRSAS